MTYLFSTLFFRKAIFGVPVSTTDEGYLIFLAGKSLTCLKKFSTQKIIKARKKPVKSHSPLSHYPLWNSYRLWNTSNTKTQRCC